jgi:hypothetical protein
MGEAEIVAALSTLHGGERTAGRLKECGLAEAVDRLTPCPLSARPYGRGMPVL